MSIYFRKAIETVAFYQKATGKEPTKPTTLYRAFTDVISNCACYEMEVCSYEDLVAHKGITTAQVANILKQYSENANNSVKKCKSYIEMYTMMILAAVLKLREI